MGNNTQLIIFVVVGLCLWLCSGQHNHECGTYEVWSENYRPGCESTCKALIPRPDCNKTIVPGCACIPLHPRKSKHLCVHPHACVLPVL
ncbi:hypothetical protein ILUMI_09330 [Ignelater luminosus]|uniref:TIL domain-containing protein n=1 Tax=Ignelater luminosus TaxID=2038154 RepID=A0A8K0D4F5_IGNLU|nr:hypothetical protein ILUMI_09330 [Ignelater luminosus]